MPTFVIRIWVSATGRKLDDGRLRGTLVDPSNGQTSQFRDERELVALLREGPLQQEELERSRGMRSGEAR